jgi:D-beta-D-heptose 7-phosphate kinase/D-beta-D-heptose 1-phosphate adenosyltransferase
VTESKILSERDLLARAEALRSRDKTIVFTNGCFDLLHSGHVRYLEEAKRMGDILVVAINNDASVRRLKGASRPIMGEGDRARIVAALQCVDYVTLFPQDTPVDLVRSLQPDIYVKGSDYRLEDLPEAAIVLAYGGKVNLVPLVAGVSTSCIIDRIKKMEEP